jgi:parallel beta-helix repeat protein
VSGHDYTPFSAAAVGLLIFDAGSIFADDNDVHDNMEGMYVQETDNVIVTNNTFTDNYDASILIYLSDNGIYDFNVFNGVPASSYGIYVYDASTGNRARNNDYLANGRNRAMAHAGVANDVADVNSEAAAQRGFGTWATRAHERDFGDALAQSDARYGEPARVKAAGDVTAAQVGAQGRLYNEYHTMK